MNRAEKAYAARMAGRTIFFTGLALIMLHGMNADDHVDHGQATTTAAPILAGTPAAAIEAQRELGRTCWSGPAPAGYHADVVVATLTDGLVVARAGTDVFNTVTDEAVYGVEHARVIQAHAYCGSN